ncbi:efflux RND transporter periplasmic adaptor subunit [Saccharicrinis aurantiacus]|uniref:efflux RND transporter periplasmic adaptor subunit n=1 Tax=Saccharicrinis aurantiacus TaxID=1849719 RepID=UPI00095020D1|nr:efflux RND transporter periplasmic adaptor subunit [Saccharicrinis aurantiacus]
MLIKHTISKAGVIFTLLLLIISCKELPEKAPVVRIDSPEVRNVELYGEYVGRVRAFKHVEVRARVEGFLEKRLFEEGGRVEEGELLFEIDPTMYRAKLNEAKAKLKQAHAARAKSERDVQRLRPLYEKNAASQLDLDNAVSSLESEEANIAISEANVAQAELQLSFTAVRSPLTGRVGERKADIGALVGGSGISLLTTVFQTDTVAVLFSLTALDYLRSKERNVNLSQLDTTKKWKPTIEVTLADNTVYPIKGIVDFTNPEVDTKTGTFIVRAELPNEGRVLLPGQFTKVKLLIDVLEKSVVIPRKSLIIEDGGAFVYVMRNDSVAEKRFVETGAELQNEIVINRGLSSYDNIVVEGQHKLNPGIKMLPIAESDTIYQFKKEE